MVAGFVHLDGGVDGLQEALLVDAGDEEAGFVEGLGALGAGTDADGREGVTDAGEETAFLGEGAAVGDDGESVHLEAVVVVEAEGLVADDARVELESAGFQALAAAGVAAVEDGHVVFPGHGVDGAEEAEEVLLGVDVFFAVGAEEDVFALLQAQALMDVGGFNLGEVLVQDFGHGGAGDVGAFLGEAAVGEVPACVFAVGHVDIGDDAAVGLFGEAFVLAAVAGFHVEDGDVEALGADDAEAAVGVAEDQDGVGFDFDHQFVALVDDVAHRGAQVFTDGVEVDVGVFELQVFEEHAVEAVVVVLAGVGEEAVEVLPAFVDDGGEADDLGAGADDDQEFKLAVILKACHIALFYGFEIGVGAVRVEEFVGPHEGDEGFGVGEVDDVVGVAGEHVDGLDLVAGDFEVEDFAGADLALLDEGAAADNDEEFPFGVVPVLALGDAGLGDVDAELAVAQGLEELGEGAAGVGVGLEREGDFFLGEVAQEGAVELFGETAGGDLGDDEGLALGFETVQEFDNLAEGGFVGRGDVAVGAVLHREYAQAVEVAAVLFPLEGFDHLVHQVVDVEELELDGGVVDGVGEVVGDGVAEGGDGAVVVGAAPFAEEVREAVDEHLCARIFAVFEEQVFTGFFAAAVFGVAEAAGEGGLLGAAEHHGAAVAVLFVGVEQGAGEAEVAGHEFFLVLGAVDAGEVEDEVGFCAGLLQICGGGVEVVFEDFFDRYAVVAGFAVLDVVELRAEVLADEAFGAGD